MADIKSGRTHKYTLGSRWGGRGGGGEEDTFIVKGNGAEYFLMQCMKGDRRHMHIFPCDKQVGGGGDI